MEMVDKNIYLIDQMWTNTPKMSSCYLIAGDKIALFDFGPATVVDTVLDSAKGLGYSPEDISLLICSHIHVDHAGGAGVLCKRYPHLKVLAHEKGVPHLADPERLRQSMIQVFGETQAGELYGDILPVPENQLRALGYGEIVDLGKGICLKVFHTPGHAEHHLSLYDEGSGTILAGEALGVYFPDVDVYSPSTPPPEFDLAAAVDSINRLEKLEPRQILYSHFGPAKDPQIAIHKAREMLVNWGRTVSDAMSKTEDRAQILEKLAQEAITAVDHVNRESADYAKYTQLMYIRATVTCGPGYIRYFKKGGQRL
ncbi:MAG: MBL fold metallo-hydrolase [Chloroflexota bacterium]|nr:MBL fold metallo-hydrolase [Chloroflexota bacterium]